MQEQFQDAIAQMEQYIAAREEYWEQNPADPDFMLEEETRSLNEQEAAIEAMLDLLIDSPGDSWQDVLAGWGDALNSGRNKSRT
jgi:hypothetical protein